MTYESHVVRSLRRDPIPGETVRLVLTLADDAPGDAGASAVAEGVESLGGDLVRELEFGRVLVEVDQAAIGEVVALDGVTAVETDAVLDQT